MLALIGSNGAGKTTLVNLVSGLLPPDSGQIMFEGRDVTDQSSYERIKAGIARSFQIVNLFDQLTCADNVALSIFSREGKTLKLTALASRDHAVWDEAHEVLRHFGLDAYGDHRRRHDLPWRAQAARRRGSLCAQAQAPFPRRADQRRIDAGEGADHGYPELDRA